LDEAAAVDVSRLRDGDALSVPGLRALSQPQRINALRHWLFSAQVVPPPTHRLAEALRQMFEAEADHLPAIVWGEFALRPYFSPRPSRRSSATRCSGRPRCAPGSIWA
jgi:hypothetical protein